MQPDVINCAAALFCTNFSMMSGSSLIVPTLKLCADLGYVLTHAPAKAAQPLEQALVLPVVPAQPLLQIVIPPQTLPLPPTQAHLTLTPVLIQPSSSSMSQCAVTKRTPGRHFWSALTNRRDSTHTWCSQIVSAMASVQVALLCGFTCVDTMRAMHQGIHRAYGDNPHNAIKAVYHMSYSMPGRKCALLRQLQRWLQEGAGWKGEDGHGSSLTVCGLTRFYNRPVPALLPLVLGIGGFASSTCVSGLLVGSRTSVCVCVCVCV